MPFPSSSHWLTHHQRSATTPDTNPTQSPPPPSPPPNTSKPQSSNQKSIFDYRPCLLGHPQWKNRGWSHSCSARFWACEVSLGGCRGRWSGRGGRGGRGGREFFGWGGLSWILVSIVGLRWCLSRCWRWSRGRGLWWLVLPPESVKVPLAASLRLLW